MNTEETTPESRTTPTTATPPEVSSRGADEPLNLPDIQAIILSGYGHLPHAAYLFLQLPRGTSGREITPEARAALRETIPEVTGARHERDRAKREKTALNLAFTYDGLAALGHSDATLETFAPEFRGGMTEDYRARALGDVKESDPKNWEWGGTAQGQTPPDLLLLCFAEDEDKLRALVHRSKARFGACGAVVIADERSTPDLHNTNEHFGFRDSITSVLIRGGFGVKDPGQSVIAPGEFILGYPNEYGQLTAWPRLNPTPSDPGVDVGKNGAYLVFRKMKQDVPAFWNYCREQADRLTAGSLPAPGEAPAPELIAAKMVGRWRSGAPLAVCPFADDKALAEDPDRVNDFAYAATDREGFGCPPGAHVRRANPRDVLSTLGPEDARRTVNHHRILRRGRPYGPQFPEPALAVDDGQRRGLLFFCINASIARQFEFVQQTWLTDGKFARMWNEPDPLTGNEDTLDAPTPAGAEFTIPQPTMRLRLQNVPRFVTVRAGAYLFLPGLAALGLLTNRVSAK
ncbi:MAG: peroxidase [Armatimonadetes bacterium]|nr:peroxidase [Armatimonadota bacterium]